MIFQGRDGEMRLIEYGDSAGTTYYLSILFHDMNLSCPIGRPQRDETLVLNRTRFDSHATTLLGDDYTRYGPLPISFTCRLDDKMYTKKLIDIMAGTTVGANFQVGGVTSIYSTKGHTDDWGGSGSSLPSFVQSGKKLAVNVEVLWDGTQDMGIRMAEVHFPPNQQTITESEDGLALNCNGEIYGGVSRITAFDARSGLTAM